MGKGKDASSRIDPVFKLKTPILFAHRGGVLEAPESTVRAFRYALDVAKAEVLELDVQMTRTGGSWFGTARSSAMSASKE